MIGFLGAGNMATAIIKGMLTNGNNTLQSLCIYDIDKSKSSLFANEGICICDDEMELVNCCDIIVLAVKPQNYRELLLKIKDCVSEDKTFVSIAAGISIDYIREILSCKCPVIRVMPNTPLLLGVGASAMAMSENVSPDKIHLIEKMFSSSGIVVKIDESKMNSVIAINGSSPAYVYLFAKAMVDYALEEGFESETAMKLICQTLRGSADMLEYSGEHIDELIRKVSSPGGTTLKALEQLNNEGFTDAINSAMHACTKRANELSRDF